DAQTVQATLANGRLTIRVALSDQTTLRPNSDVVLPSSQRFPTVIGAPAHYLALDEAIADDATSYTEGSVPFSLEIVEFENLITPLPPINSVTLHFRARATVGTATVFCQLQNPLTNTWATGYGAGVTVPLGTWTDYTFDSPATDAGVPWTANDVQV